MGDVWNARYALLLERLSERNEVLSTAVIEALQAAGLQHTAIGVGRT